MTGPTRQDHTEAAAQTARLAKAAAASRHLRRLGAGLARARGPARAALVLAPAAGSLGRRADDLADLVRRLRRLDRQLAELAGGNPLPPTT